MSESANVGESSAAPAEAPTEATSEAEISPVFSGLGEESGNSNLHDVTVFGESKQVPYKELIAMAQKGEAADQKFREASDIKKEYGGVKEDYDNLQKDYQAMQANVNSLMDQLKNDPMKVLSHEKLGHNMQDLLYNKMEEQLQYDEMDEIERENHDLKTRLQAYEEQKKETQEKEAHAESERGQQAYANNIAMALQEGGIAPTANNIRIAASVLLDTCGRDSKPAITWREMVHRTKGKLKEEATQIYGNLDPEQVMELLGDDVTKKIRSHDIQKVKNNFKMNQPQNDLIPAPQTKKHFMTKEEWREKMQKLKQNLA